MRGLRVEARSDGRSSKKPAVTERGGGLDGTNEAIEDRF